MHSKNNVQCNIEHCITVQCITIQYSALHQYSAVQCSNLSIILCYSMHYTDDDKEKIHQPNFPIDSKNSKMVKTN